MKSLSIPIALAVLALSTPALAAEDEMMKCCCCEKMKEGGECCKEEAADHAEEHGDHTEHGAQTPAE